jgi:hypothetical protein
MVFDISIKKANLPLNMLKIIRVAVDCRCDCGSQGQVRGFPF